MTTGTRHIARCPSRQAELIHHLGSHFDRMRSSAIRAVARKMLDESDAAQRQARL